MTCLCVSGAVIYLLPYSTEVYYKPLKEALGITNAEIGWLMSTLGIVNMLGYFPGGWLADRFTPRKLLTFSLVATGAIGLYFATFPPYWVCVVIYAGFSLTSILTFWAALIKATRDWGGSDEQGRAFGILEGGRGVIRFAVSSLGVTVLGWFAGKQAGFSAVVTLYASLNIALGIMVWFALRQPDDQPTPTAAKPENRPDPKQMLQVLKLPAVWLIALIIFSAYAMYLGSFYFTPYATDAFGVGVVMAGYLSAGKMIVRPISAAGAGFLGDKVNASRVIMVAFLVGVVSFGLFAVTPTFSALLRFSDVAAPSKLVEALKDPGDPVAAHLMAGLSEDFRASLREAPTGAEPPVELTATLLNAINDRLDEGLLYTERRFDHVELRPVTRDLLPSNDEKLAEERRTRVNRLLIEDAFPGAIEPMSAPRARSGTPTWVLVFLVVNVLVGTLCLYALRGLYYALLEEGNVPIALTGTATGVVSVLGYTPDIFIPPIVGFLLDRFPGGAGYRYIFSIVSLFCVAGLAASFVFARRQWGTVEEPPAPATAPPARATEA